MTFQDLINDLKELKESYQKLNIKGELGYSPIFLPLKDNHSGNVKLRIVEGFSKNLETVKEFIEKWKFLVDECGEAPIDIIDPNGLEIKPRISIQNNEPNGEPIAIIVS